MGKLQSSSRHKLCEDLEVSRLSSDRTASARFVKFILWTERLGSAGREFLQFSKVH